MSEHSDSEFDILGLVADRAASASDELKAEKLVNDDENLKKQAKASYVSNYVPGATEGTSASPMAAAALRVSESRMAKDPLGMGVPMPVLTGVGIPVAAVPGATAIGATTACAEASSSPGSDEKYSNKDVLAGVGIPVVAAVPGATAIGATTACAEASSSPGPDEKDSNNDEKNNSKDPAVPRPAPLNRNGQFVAVGAFGMVGPSGINPAQDLGSLEFSMGAAQEGLAMSITETQEDGLLVATPVMEGDDPHPSTLPRARESETNPHIYNQSTKGGRMRVLLGILALVVTAVLLGVFVPKRIKEGSSKEEPSTSPTLSRTQAPTSLEESILSNLPQETVDTILTQPESPQARAFEWVLNDIDYSHEHIIQRYVLAVLYYETNGEEWLANDFWLDHNVSECEWYNKHNFGMKEELLVSIPYFLDDFVQPPASERCNDDGLYSHLWLDANGLVGSIPEELYLMDSLKTLGLGFNQIEGTISINVGTLTDLIGLFIPFAALTGTLPSQLGLLSSLEVANLYVNGLSGQVPDTIWSYPNMTSWGFTSSNPQIEPYMLPTEIGIMTNMRWFGVEGSNTYGTFPTEIGLMRDMVGFWCSGVPGSESVYTGTLPTEFGLMTNVLTIEVNFNALTGTVPTEFGQLEKLNYLNLQNNSLTGPLPQELENLSNLDNMLIQGNGFTGIIPEALCNMNGSCYAYPGHCAAQEQPLQFDCSTEFCGCECSCNNSAI